MPTKTKVKTITTEEFDAKVDRGEDVSEYWDLTKIRHVNEGGLPSIIEVIIEDQTEKITIPLTSYSVAFFKSVAKKHKSSYQRIIRRLLHEYAKRESQRKSMQYVNEPAQRSPSPTRTARKEKKKTTRRKKAGKIPASVR